MKEKNNYVRFMLILIVLLLFIVIGLLAIPEMNSAREKAFKVEAATILTSAKSTLEKIDLNSMTTTGSSSCRKGNTYCFTLKELKLLETYKTSSDNYVGKVEIDLNDVDNPEYMLYLYRSADLKMLFASTKNFANMGSAYLGSWLEEYETCNCELNN